MSRVSHGIDRVAVSFDDPNLVANAGLMVVATLALRLGLERLINARVRLAGRVGGALPGRKAMTLVHTTRRFVEELVARLRRAGATGEVVLRMDSGFWSNDTIALLGRLDVRYTMAVRTGNKAVARAVAAIDDKQWADIDYTPGGRAQVAETTYRGRRLIVRRTRLTDARQARLWPAWRHFAFLTDLDGDTAAVDAFHRGHAEVELAIRDLKEGAGMEHVPSGRFFANGAWLCCAVLAHNLIRWAVTIRTPAEGLVVARTVRTRLVAVPARLVNRAGTLTLRCPSQWPWAEWFTRRLAGVRSLPDTG